MKKIAILFLAAAFTSCGVNKKMTKSEDNSLNSKWELATLDGKRVDAEQPIYIQLTKDNKISGFVGCNRVTGSYETMKDGKISFKQLGVTRMACPDMNMESNVLAMLNKVNNFSMKNGQLMLNAGGDSPLATFTKISDEGISNRYWKLKTIDGKAVEMADNQQREQYFILRNDGTMSGFAGCNQLNGQYKLEDGNRIRFNGNMAMTMMACPDVNVDERAFTKVFELADNYTIANDILSLNVGRRAPLATFEAIYFD